MEGERSIANTVRSSRRVLQYISQILHRWTVRASRSCCRVLRYSSQILHR